MESVHVAAEAMASIADAAATDATTASAPMVAPTSTTTVAVDSSAANASNAPVGEAPAGDAAADNTFTAPVDTVAASTPSPATATTAKAKNFSESFDVDERRRLKNEAYVNSGCGKNREKDRIISTFWDVVWPRLEKHGWTILEGQGNDSGMLYFFPKGATPQSIGTGTKLRDYYDRIKDVLDRLRDKRTKSEGAIFEAFDAECYRLEMEEHRSTRKRKPPPPPGAATETSPTKKAPKQDAWKEGRKFAKKTSRVGAAYQPKSIPSVGEAPAMEGEPTILWSPTAAVEAGASLETLESLVKDIPTNKKWPVLCKLAQAGYKVEEGELDAIVASVPATDGSDWDASKKLQFGQEMFNTRKNLDAVCKNMGIDIETCLVFYYRHFKSSTHYRLMKAVFADEHYEKTARFETDYDVCAVCGDGGELVICDQCEGEYHLKCMRPPLRSVPEGRWECDECVDRKVLQLRHFLLTQTGLAASVQGGDGNQEGLLAPTDDTLDVVRRFGSKLSELLATTEDGEVEVEPEELTEDDDTDSEMKMEEETADVPHEKDANDSEMKEAADLPETHVKEESAQAREKVAKDSEMNETTDLSEKPMEEEKGEQHKAQEDLAEPVDTKPSADVPN